MSDKTIVISGPFGLLAQSLTQEFTQNGADVALLVEDPSGAQRFCQNISDLREMSEKFGRAVALFSNPKTEKEAQIDIGRCAEVFGTTDIYIDTHLFHAQLPFFKNIEHPDKVEVDFSESLKKAYLMTQGALFFLKARHKSRIIYLLNELDELTLNSVQSNKIKEFYTLLQKMALETVNDHITFNAISVGASEDYLLTRFKAPTVSLSLKKLQEHYPDARLVDYRDISYLASFIASGLSHSLNGQVIKLNHGLITD